MSGVPFDVSDCILDPDFSQEFSIARVTEGVDTKGRTTTSNVTIMCVGVIAPATAEQLERVPEADRSSEVIAIYSTTLLTPGSTIYKPDVVTWRGGTYRVTSVMDFMDYGAGYCLALCSSRDMQGKEPDA